MLFIIFKNNFNGVLKKGESVKNKALLLLLALGGGNGAQAYDMGDIFLDFLKDCVSEFVSDFIEDNSSYSCEKKQRRDLYYAVKGNPYFYKMGDIEGSRDYLIPVLRSHIQRLEQKFQENKPWYKTGSAIKSLVSSTFASCFYFYLYTKIKIMDISFDIASVDDGIVLGLFAAAPVFFTLVSIGYLNKAVHYKERIMKRLERDENILKILENS